MQIVECEGAPRDLGRDQGTACAERLRLRFAGLPLALRLRLRAGAPGAGAAALARELARHHPRQAETLAGMAAAAGVPRAWLALALEQETARAEPERAAALAPGRVGRAADGEWILRRVRPEGGFRSLELSRPWLAHPLLGVNEEGLAAAVLCGGAAGALLPAAPLVQDCLHRFATLEACVEWCEGRPGERPAAILLADASGACARVALGPGRRAVDRAGDASPPAPGLAWADARSRSLSLGGESVGC